MQEIGTCKIEVVFFYLFFFIVFRGFLEIVTGCPRV